MTWIQAAFRLMLMGGVILILSAIYIVLIIRFYRYLQVKVARDHIIKLINQGNVRSVFQLKVESPDPRLHFKLLYKGMPLVEIPENPVPEPTSAVYEASDTTTTLRSEPGKKAARNGSKLSTSQVTDTGREIAGKAGVLASLLGTIGGLIPGSLGTQLRSKGASVRRVQASTLKTTQAPVRTQQKINALKMDSSKLARTGNGLGSPTRGDVNTPEYGQTVGESPSVKGPDIKRSRRPVSEYQAQTKDVEPGEALSLTLRIDSKVKHHLEGSYLYIVHSQQVPLEPANIEIPQVTTRGTVHFKPVSFWRYWLPLMVCGLVVIVTLFSLSTIFLQG